MSTTIWACARSNTFFLNTYSTTHGSFGRGLFLTAVQNIISIATLRIFIEKYRKRNKHGRWKSYMSYGKTTSGFCNVKKKILESWDYLIKYIQEPENRQCLVCNGKDVNDEQLRALKAVKTFSQPLGLRPILVDLCRKSITQLLWNLVFRYLKKPKRRPYGKIRLALVKKGYMVGCCIRLLTYVGLAGVYIQQPKYYSRSL